MNRSKAIRNVSVYGFCGNIFLLVIKLIVGFTTNSQAMIADGLNSSSDVFASVMTFIGNHISAQPDDHDHPYGHGKAEYIFSFIISFSFLFVAYLVLKSGIDSLFNIKPVHYSHWLVVVAIITLILKSILYVSANRVGKKYSSLLALANSHDHRNDLFITSLTLVSIICSYFHFYTVDAIISILISFWIGYTGIQVWLASYHVLMDRTLDEKIVDEMKANIEAIPEVDHIDSVVARPIGVKFLMLVKVSVDGTMSVQEGHDVSDKVKALIMSYEEVSDVVIHINPAQTHPQRNYLK